MPKQIEEIREHLFQQHLDGWLLYDNHGSNRFARQLLFIPPSAVLTRRFFYWIPSVGEPVKIVHQIEADCLDHLPGEKMIYLSWKDLDEALTMSLGEAKKIAMEYSPKNAIPYVSVVDAGTIEMVKKNGKKVVSSAQLLPHFTSVLSQEQIESHKETAKILQEILDRAWELIAEHVRHEKKITEFDVQKFILSEFTAHNCVTDDGPTCSVNEHTAHPHYVATRANCKTLERGDFVMIDLWCKKNTQQSIYADITRIAVLGSEPSPMHQKIFDIVKLAQQEAIRFIKYRLEKGKAIRGYEVDDIARKVIEEAGYGNCFTHRTGHNIDTDVHGSGAHLDNLETSDQRDILAGTCFSLEPAIYIPDHFGVRIETNLLIYKDRTVEVTGGLEESILCLL